jgi:GrpB-like predicted nucleotidyltransferase (UPF0157 family)
MVDTIPVELVPHSPLWAGMAASEARRLESALGDVLLTVHHIGSTSIPTIMAKPIVDMIPIVTNLAALDAAMPRIVALGYKALGEFGIPGRRYCHWTNPATGKRQFQLHCFEAGSPQIARHLAFRDYLRAHPDKAREYEAEKIRAAALHPDNTLDYNAEKNDWIKATEIAALAWQAARK